MEELDHNTKAHIADYLNGKSVILSPREYELLDDDDVVAECLSIAEISAEYDSQNVTDKKSKSKILRLSLIVATMAACVVLILLIPSLNNDNESINTPVQGLLTPIAESNAIDQGFFELPPEFEQLIRSAASRSYFDYEPNTPFDIEFSTEIISDTLFLCSPGVSTPLLVLPVSGTAAPIQNGLAPGLYYYYLKYNIKERNAISVGKDD